MKITCWNCGAKHHFDDDSESFTTGRTIESYIMEIATLTSLFCKCDAVIAIMVHQPSHGVVVFTQ
jgi:hypothetical protein